jgi:Subtilase family
MRIPVLVVLPAQEPLRESAAASFERRISRIPLGATKTPKGVQLDASVAPVPLGSPKHPPTIASIDPQSSETFAVRGYVEAESPEDIPTEADGRPVFADPNIAAFITCGGTPPVGTAQTVQTKLNVSQLAAKGLDGSGVAVAIMDTGINLSYLKSKLGTQPVIDAANSWTPPGATTQPFQYGVDHGTMCAYDVLIGAPKATLLDFPILAGSAPGSSVVGRTLSTALLGYAQLIAFWSVAFASGGAARYKALVVNNSWGIYHPGWDFPAGHPGRYCDNPRHPFNVIAGTLATSADIVFAAGNCGAQCADQRCQNRVTETIMGANAHPDVLTIAACDTNDLRVGYSSQGPGIKGMTHDKPDITTYSHFAGSEVFGAGSPDSGTSAACPVASGCIAALRTKLTPSAVPPANLFAQIRTTARQASGQTGWNGDYGCGIFDALATAQSLGL